MQLIINSSVFRCVTLQVSSNGDIERTQTQRPSALEDTAPSAAEETSRTGFGTGEEQHTMRLSSPNFLRTDRPNRDVDGVFTTEMPDVDGDEGSADTDMSGSCTGDSSNPSSRADVSSLDREIADCEDDAYDTDLESDEESPDRRRKKPLRYDPVGTNTYLEECERLGITPITYFLRTIEDPVLAMKHHGLGELDMKALAKPLQFSDITTGVMLVPDSSILLSLVDHLLCTQNNTRIETIDLEGNDIGPRGAKYLSRALRENVFVTQLVLADNNIGSSGAEVLCKMLGENYAISTLDLSSNNFKDTDGKYFYELLFNNMHLTTVSLRHNHFEDQAAIFLRDAIVNNSHLKVLDLSWNKFRMKGAMYITDIILENDSLKYLDLSMNGLSNEGARLIGEALAANENLQELNISGNRIGIEGASHIARALQTNSTLHTLRVTSVNVNCMLSTGHFECVSRKTLGLSHARHRGMEGVKMGNNPLGKEGAGAFLLLQAIQKNLENSALNLLDVMNVVVTKEFEALHKEINAARTKYLQVIHGGVLFHNKHVIIFEELDPNKEFERDPMTKLKKYADAVKYRLIDVFRQFDRNNDWKLTREEVQRGVRAARLDITSDDVDELITRLDRNGDGEIDYEELMFADDENRRTKRQIDAYLAERKALLKPEDKEEVTLSLGTVQTIDDQLALVQQETPVQETR
ncbi:hypothetical protein LSAT2_002305 [Lamellibrachia satsuma]|nr:hypothetical protein LSAT2_002305 [Lamellibrachia satsuma]